MSLRYICLAVLSILALYVIIRERAFPNNRVLIPLGLFILFMFISTLKARDFEVAFWGIRNTFYVELTTPSPTLIPFEAHRFTGFTTHLFCAILFLLAAKEEEHERLLKVLIGGAVIVSCIAVLQFYKIDIMKFVFANRNTNSLSATMGNRNFLATYFVLILPASVCLYLQKEKNIWLITSGFIYAGLLAAKTRGAWMAAGIMFVFIICKELFKKRNRRSRIKVLKLVIVFLLITVVMNLFDGDVLRRIFSIKDQIQLAAEMDDSAGSSRMYIWKKTYKVFLKNWAFGIGPDHLIYEEIMMPGNNAMIADKTHNIYLEIAATMGSFALISYIAFLSTFLRRWKDQMGFIYFTMILSYLIQGFFNIDTIMVLPLFWIVLGFALSNMTEGNL